MTTASSHEITQLLLAWSEGDLSAQERLIPFVYQELHRLAHRFMSKERSGQTLQTTALVNEAYLRLVKTENLRWQDRAHFFAISAEIMRRILVDFARSRRYLKRGGGAHKISFDPSLVLSRERGADLVALDDALVALSKTEPRKCRVVELRFFGGLSVEETAEVLKVSPDTVMRDWKLAKALLLRELRSGKKDVS
ncbi:MAG: sigma-70 family RNA polymerase sigma factor [Acidobacteria bacterium]|nr:sigma-70 family RNA polymerase sigma factor [Acidobacteriota bacterium]